MDGIEVELTLSPWKDDLPRLEMETREACPVGRRRQPARMQGQLDDFPAKEPTYLTTFMAQDFVDSYFGIWDLDEFANYSTAELIEYMREVRPRRHKMNGGVLCAR